MDILAPISTIMTKDVIYVAEKDDLIQVRELFKRKRIHHLPVVRSGEIVGIISKSDLFLFMKGLGDNVIDEIINETRLKRYHAEDIMTRGIAKMAPTQRINVALEIFVENLFHAIPIVENERLVGIVTTYDIIKALRDENRRTAN